MKRHWSTIAGLPVLAHEGERQLGRLRGVFVHPETGQILAFLVGLFKVITPRDVRQWENDCVWVNDPEDLLSPSEVLRLEEFGLRRTLLNGKKVLTRSGKRLGTLYDFSFDPATDRLATLDVARRFLFWEWDYRTFDAKDIQEITASAIVLNADNMQKQKERATDSATLSVAV